MRQDGNVARDRSAASEELVAELRRIGVEAGLDAVGVALAQPFTTTRRHLEERKAEGLHGGMQFTYRNPGRSTDPGRIVAGAAALVVGAQRYLRTDPGPRRGTRPEGRVARYAWRDQYADLRQALELVANRLRAEGFVARVVADDNSLVDREAAYRAGLGWYGKNTNLLLPGLGSWFVLGAVVTDAPLPAADVPVGDGCGTCTRCLPACPTGAFIRPGVLDARRCLAWLVQAPGSFPLAQREALGDRVYGCDECQEVCPVNHRAARARPPAPATETDQARVDLLEILAASDRQIMARLGRWYIPNRQPRYVRRNALIALANTADPTDPAVIDAIRTALASPDPMLRSHAVWAAARLGHPDLLEGLGDASQDPSVRQELAAVPGVNARAH
jgi:epoxyqueuosine reductase